MWMTLTQRWPPSLMRVAARATHACHCATLGGRRSGASTFARSAARSTSTTASMPTALPTFAARAWLALALPTTLHHLHNLHNLHPPPPLARSNLYNTSTNISVELLRQTRLAPQWLQQQGTGNLSALEPQRWPQQQRHPPRHRRLYPLQLRPHGRAHPTAATPATPQRQRLPTSLLRSPLPAAPRLPHLSSLPGHPSAVAACPLGTTSLPSCPPPPWPCPSPCQCQRQPPAVLRASPPPLLRPTITPHTIAEEGHRSLRCRWEQEAEVAPPGCRQL